MKHRNTIVAVLATWIVLSFVPSLSLKSILGRGKNGQ